MAESLADMAFRLRDEVGDRWELWTAFCLIYDWRHTPEAWRDLAYLLEEARTHPNLFGIIGKTRITEYAKWIIMSSQKVFIVAALIARELK